METLQDVAKKLEDKYYGLESQTRELEGIFEEFCNSNKGGSAIVMGPRHSGKHSIITKVKRKYEGRVEIKEINGLTCSTDTMALRFLNDTDHKTPCFVILYNFEQFVLRSDQIFLYKVLNATRHQPVFALCVTFQTDHIELLEKRVRSRLLSTIVSFARVQRGFEEFRSAFQYFLGVDQDEYDSTIEGFISRDVIQEQLRSVYNEKGNNYAVLKQIVTVFLSFLEADGIPAIYDERSSAVFCDAKESVVSSRNSMKTVIMGLTLRQLCLVTSCVRLRKEKRRTTEFAYDEIVSMYKRFVKGNITPLKPTVDNTVLYKELDALCSLGILTNSTCVGQVGYKKTSLQGEYSLMENCLKEFPSLPTGLRQWLDEYN